MRKYFLKVLSFAFAFFVLVLPTLSLAREPGEITDWYIKDFQSTIIVNKDSSLLIEEKITADCGNLPDKHGIFRILPLQVQAGEEKIKTPVELIGITDFEGNRLPYSTAIDRINNTVTWKIGDPNKTVTGENYYRITYVVKNAIRFENSGFDEFYWNLVGNFWDIDIDKFSVDINFPEEVSQDNTQIDYYTGLFGSTGKEGASYQWKSANILGFLSEQGLKAREGITVSITFPKNIFTPYQPGFFELYGNYLWFFVPVISFIFCFYLWFKHGKDPKINKAITPEFEIPENLTPLEMGPLIKNGDIIDSFISAAIVDLAVKKYIIIEQIDRAWYSGGKDFKLTKIRPEEEFLALNFPERVLVEKIFGEKKEVFLSLLKTKFYKELPAIQRTTVDNLALKDLISTKGRTLRTIFFVSAAVLLFAALLLAIFFLSIPAGASLGLSAIIFISFGIVMPKRTPKGAELNWRIKGFEMYMRKAEIYRQRFNEKENIFEKFLPYAMVFGITKLWIKKMEEIYGKEYFQSYHAVWFAGAAAGSFNADSFASQMNSLSSGISSSVGTSSGAGGSGGSGGGGGGGGGGGW